MTFRDLHYDELPLVLPNAWDVPSALALVAAGFAAVGTTSFGVAASHGATDRPLNVLPIPGLTPADLADLGVRRVSTGSPYRAATHAAVAAALAVRDGSAFPDATAYGDLQDELVRYANGG